VHEFLVAHVVVSRLVPLSLKSAGPRLELHLSRRLADPFLHFFPLIFPPLPIRHKIPMTVCPSSALQHLRFLTVYFFSAGYGTVRKLILGAPLADSSLVVTRPPLSRFSARFSRARPSPDLARCSRAGVFFVETNFVDVYLASRPFLSLSALSPFSFFPCLGASS